MTDGLKSKGPSPAASPAGGMRLKRFVAAIVLLAAALIAVWWIRRAPGPMLAPPEVTTEGLPHLAAREIAPIYDQALKSPESAEAWGNLGMALWVHNSEVSARRCLAYAHSLDPGEFQWPYLIAVSLSAVDPPAAVDHLREAIAIRSDVAVAHVRLAELVLEMNQLDEAQQHLDIALQLEPTNLHALIASARVQLGRGDLHSSLRFAENAARVGPHLRASHELLAYVHQCLGDREEALRHSAIVEKLPDTLLEHDDPFEAKVWAGRLDTQQRLEQGQKLLAENQLMEAIQLFSAAWDDDPTEPRLPCELARALVLAKTPELAAGVLKRAAEEHPNSALVRLRIGVVHFMQSKYQDAVDAFQKATELKPDYAIAYAYLGDSHDKLGDHAKAASAFQTVVRLEPDNGAAHRSLGRILLKQGKTEEARRHLQTVLQLAPDDNEARGLLLQAGPAPPGAAAPAESPEAAK